MNADLPTTIPAYLERLRAALAGCDPAMAQDALYDAEEYLRSELAASPGKSEAEVISSVAGSYGAPDEVADIYRETEVKVQTALRLPRPASTSRPAASIWQRLFGVFVDPRTYGALFYLLLAMATGTFYFTWTVTGIGLSLGLSILIFGLPFVVLFVGATRVLALVEGRIVEVMLGERMPRRPLYSDAELPLLTRIGAMFTDARTWGTFLYFVLMLPLGIVYGTLAITGIALSFAFLVSPVMVALGYGGNIHFGGGAFIFNEEAWHFAPVMFLCGAALLLITLHGARLIGRLHAQIAKHLLVQA